MTNSYSISTATDGFDLSAVPLIDHHAHPLLRDPAVAGAPAFRRFFSESTDPGMAAHLGTTVFYRRAVRDLAALFGCEATEQAVLDVRARTPFADYARRCFDAACLRMLLLDAGFQTASSIGVEETAALSGVPAAPILRLESYAEDVIERMGSLADVEEALRMRIRGARAEGIVALKSIAAYRGGLHVERRGKADAEAALAEVRIAHRGAGRIRLSNRPLLEYLLFVALEEAAASELPVQFHVAFGDDDTDLRLANPLQMRALLQDARLRSVPIILLHCYPYVREAGYLANLYSNVYVDVSLSVPLTAAGSSARFAEALELAPTGKVLFGTDAHSIPELFYVAALHGRRALAACLQQLVAQDYLTVAEAAAAAEQILWQNADRIYGLGRENTGLGRENTG